jgi:hypothetical protein
MGRDGIGPKRTNGPHSLQKIMQTLKRRRAVKRLEGNTRSRPQRDCQSHSGVTQTACTVHEPIACRVDHGASLGYRSDEGTSCLDARGAWGERGQVINRSGNDHPNIPKSSGESDKRPPLMARPVFPHMEVSSTMWSSQKNVSREFSHSIFSRTDRGGNSSYRIDESRTPSPTANEGFTSR